MPAGTVTVGASVTVDNLNVGAAGNVRVVAPLTVLGTLRVDGSMISTARPMTVNTLAGAGTLTLGMQPGSGSLTTNASALTIPAGLTLRLVEESSAGRADRPFINQGSIVGGGGGPGSIGGAGIVGSSIVNQGTIEALGVLKLTGTQTRADLGNLVWSPIGGTFQMNGTLLNAGQIFHVEVGKPWYLTGTISGGTVNIDNGTALTVPYFAGAALDDVVVNGKVHHGGGMPIRTSNLQGNAVFELESQFAEGPSRIYSSSTLTIASTVLVHGAGGFSIPPNFGMGSGVEAATAIVNHGTLRADAPVSGGSQSGEFVILAPKTLNDGTLATGSTQFLYASGDVTFQPGGALDIAMTSQANAGLLRVAGKLDLTAASDALLLAPNANMTSGTFYRIVTTSAGVTGTFDSVTPGFEVMYTSTEIFARVVPEPATLGCIAAGAAAAASFAQRRRRNS